MSRLSQDAANDLARVSAALLCMDVPTNISFGIDYMTFATGERFKGVKVRAVVR
jgi:hypothetical protein